MNTPQLHVPDELAQQLLGYRRSVWKLKLAEAAWFAALAVLGAMLIVFAADRVADTSPLIRTAVLLAAIASCGAIPWFFYRWVWRRRTLEQLALLLSKRMPRLGDSLLGVIELAHDPSEQARSRALCAAAIAQVADESKQRDFRTALPESRLRTFATSATICLAIALGLAFAFPEAASSAWARLLAPWQGTPRYTFAALEPLPEQLIVPHGESFTLTVKLQESSRWRPESGEVQLGLQTPLTATVSNGAYVFELPPQIEPGELTVRIGDARHAVPIEPTLRPELTAVDAVVDLPAYLERPAPVEKDVRGGAVSLVKGSSAKFRATASRDLTSAEIDRKPIEPQRATFVSPAHPIGDEQQVEFRWKDEFGLSGKEPFRLSIAALDDQAPTVLSEQLPRQKVVLDSELISFRVKAHDDFGVRRVGYEWRGFEEVMGTQAAKGEKLLAAGGPESESLAADAAFSATSLGIEPQPIELRVFVEDYLPDRKRVYSSPHLLYILTPEQHAIWMTEQLSKWHRRSLEVRDRELRLYDANRELRKLDSEQLDAPETRRKLERQASAEQANGRRLAHLSASGAELIRQASRNPEIGVGHLERWAEMLQVLDDIADQRMPSVADLLKESALAARTGKPKPPSGPSAGMNRNTRAGAGSEATADAKHSKPVPTIADVESSQQPPDEEEDVASSESKGSQPRLTLPTTTLIGKRGEPGECPAGEALDEAVEEQEDLLAEFEKLADEMNEILANLEGSTLVKRLKAASRRQYKVSGRITEQLEGTFGRRAFAFQEEHKEEFQQLEEQQSKNSYNVSIIMDDMQAYFERRRMVRFKTVLGEMREQDVVGGLRSLGEEIEAEQGLSIALCEFWSDTLDRWAEDLVDPACSGSCPGGKSPGSLPPSIVLEALRILEAEINLREETRVAEQARGAASDLAYRDEATGLSRRQEKILVRVDKLAEAIRDLPEGSARFAKEIELLGAVSRAMDDAATILARPDTGAPAIAAETEAIELLLQSKRINPGGGGGGGSSPGGGGGGDTNDSAIALVGRGDNEKAVERTGEVAQVTGDSTSPLPAEFRAGLDEYFNRLDQ
ncbi:hypothetical protein OAS39_02490 [Pirellulales bacterium]|nr:hypothetical protein [Pirellulales bacterium]